MNNSIVLKTYIWNYSYDENDYFTEKEEKYLCTDDPLAKIAMQKMLEENDGDYPNGYIHLSYNNHVIFSDEMDTTELLISWSGLYRILRDHNKEKNFSITFLDNEYADSDIKEENGKYGVSFHHPYFKNEYEIPCVIPKKELLLKIKEEFSKFVEFCQNPAFYFSDESSIHYVMKDYQSLKDIEI